MKPGADAPPATSVAAMGDHPTSTALFAAIATGLYRRERTGKGGVVGTSLLANGMWSNSSLLQASLDKVDLPPVKPRTEASPLFNNYRCKCGKWLNLSILNFEKLFPPAARILGIPELIGDPRFLTPEGRRDNAAVMVAILDKAFATQDREYWAQEFEKAGITWAKISTLQDVISDPQAHAAGHIVPFVDGSGMTINTPIELGGVEKKRPTRAPELGQHTWEVLHELGYSEKEIERMAKDGIIVESAGVRSKL